MTSRAVIFTAPQAPLELRSMARPCLGAGELLVRVSMCTLCASDLHSYRGARSVEVPTVLGHEIIGVIEEIGEGPQRCDLKGRALAIGDRVTWCIAASCGDCFFCREGLPQKCVCVFKYGHAAIAPEHELCGGLAEHCHLTANTGVLSVPEELPDAVACPANCATATVAAALRTAGGLAGRVVCVHGAGMLGLTACAMARESGAEVVVCDTDPSRLALASHFGVSEVVTMTDGTEALRGILAEMTDGRGADVGFEMSGAPSAVSALIETLRIGGLGVLVGSVSPADPVRLAAEDLVKRSLTLRGVHNYAPEDLAVAIDFLELFHHRYPFAELVTPAFSLDEIEAAFGHALSGKDLRVAIAPTV